MSSDNVPIARFIGEYAKRASNAPYETDMFGMAPPSTDELLQNAAKNAASAPDRLLSVTSFSPNLFNDENDVLGEARAVYDAWHNPDGSAKPGWMKAPNGRPTNLTERQWCQVRTPSFKRWFGDWEMSSTLSSIELLRPVEIKDLEDGFDAKVAYSALENGMNALDGREVRFVNSTLGKILRHRGYDTSRLVPHLKEVFDAAIPIGFEAERAMPARGDGTPHKEHRNFVGYHNYLGKIADGGRTYFVRFTVQELRTRSKSFVPNELHSTFVSDVDLYSEADLLALDTAKGAGKVGAVGLTDGIVAKRLAEFKVARENSSKGVDENGEPRVVYHATDNAFTVFDRSRLGENTYRNASDEAARQMAMLGFWFNEKDLRGKTYQDRSIAAYVDVKNPYETTFDELWDELSETSHEEFIDCLKEEGYDGIVLEDTEFGGKSFVLLEPNQIKSATDNVGTFSGDPDIRYSVVSDKQLIDKLDSEPTVIVYRAMQLIDGKLYPPMAAKIENEYVEATEFDIWYKSDEHPELAIPVIDEKTGLQKIDRKTRRPIFVFRLNKGNGKSIEAAYNPYWHTSRSPLNDQFSSASDRPNLVVVECEIPAGELISDYKAKNAKDSVGEKDWHSGPVSSWLAEYGKKRKVILSRYNKILRILQDEEVAREIKKLIEGTDISIPENVITPSLREALEKIGVDISRQSRAAYSWDKLTKKGKKPRKVKLPHFKTGAFNKNASQDEIVDAAKKSVRNAGGTDTKRGLSINIPAFGDVVVVGKPGLRHGLRPYGARYSRIANIDNADILTVIGEVLKNSVPVNEVRPRENDKTSGATILFGAAIDENSYIVPVVSVVNHIKDTNETPPVSVFPLKSINTKGHLKHAFDTENIENALSEVNLADLIFEVNDKIPIFSKDVYNHFKTVRPATEDFGAFRFSVTAETTAMDATNPRSPLMNELYSQAGENSHAVGNIVRGLYNRIPGTRFIERDPNRDEGDVRVKTRESTIAKANRLYGGDVTQVTDIAGSTLVMPENASRSDFENAFELLKGIAPEEGAYVVGVSKPDGDILSGGVRAVLRFANGGLGEVALEPSDTMNLLYSVSSVNGIPYVEVDTDQHIFDGVSPNDYQKVVRKYLNKKFSKRIIGVKPKNAYVKSEGISEYIYPSKHISRELLEAKLRASTELDNLMRASFYEGHTDDRENHKHEKATGGWDYYRVIFHIGNKWLSGKINVMVTDNGRVFYDITDIKNETAKSVRSLYALSHSPSQGGSDASIVAKKTEEVNSQVTGKLNQRDDNVISSMSDVAEALGDAVDVGDLKEQFSVSTEALVQEKIRDYATTKEAKRNG